MPHMLVKYTTPTRLSAWRTRRELAAAPCGPTVRVADQEGSKNFARVARCIAGLRVQHTPVYLIHRPLGGNQGIT